LNFADCLALALARHVEGTAVTGNLEFKKTEGLVSIKNAGLYFSVKKNYI
jgi:hypothetical protein